MSNITVTGNQAYFNEDAKFFKDVYIYGTLFYDFETAQINVAEFGDVKINGGLDVYGNSNFYGPARFYQDVYFDENINVGILTVRKRLDVGIGGTTLRANADSGRVGIRSESPKKELDVVGTAIFSESIGIKTASPREELDVIGTALISDKVGINIDSPRKALDVVGIAIVSDKVGIGSIEPEQKVDVAGSIKIDEFIYDSVNSPGVNGYYLNMDSSGIRWISATPNFSEGIYVQDEGTYIPTAGIAQSFTVLNFKQINSFGTGTDTIIPIPNPSNPTFIADIQSKDLWGFTGGGDIYRMSKVGIQNNSPSSTLDVTGTVHATGAVDFDSTLNVDGATTLNNTLDVDGATTLNNTLDVDGATTLNNTLDVDGATTLNNTLDVDGTSVFNNTVELNSSLIDINNSTATGKFDYRLSSVGTGVSWRPPGVQTQNAIWVTMDGNDSNTGYLEGDAKRTIGAAASIAEPGDTIFIRSGVYFEDNPIGLRTDVSVSGQDLRLVTIIPNNPIKDVFHVRRGCLVENVSFAGTNVSVAHTGAGAVAFPPTVSDVNAGIAYSAVTGYLAPGPTTEGPTGRWKSPYIRNCTNFMTKSIGMKINGNHATASTIGADLKCMVCDSFTQYNENGIGVSITNNGYAQLVSIFTINCDIGIFAASGGSCDLTNSNSSFGNYGLYAVGLGSTEFTAKVGNFAQNFTENITRTVPGVDAGSDKVIFQDMKDAGGLVRRPYDGQALFFKIDLTKYADVDQTYVAGLSSSILQEPMIRVQEVKVGYGGSGFSAATPPTVLIRDANDQTQQPKGPQGIIAEVSPTIDPATGAITAIDIVNSGRNYLPTQNLEVFIDGDNPGNPVVYELITQPIYYSVDVATQVTAVTGITTVTFNEFIPYELFGNEDVSLKRISRILTSSHSFEYIGTGVDINTSTPFKGSVPVKENEIVALDGAQVPFTSTDQKGNFDIGEGFQINQPTATIRGRDFSKAIQAEVTPLILALR